MIIRRMTEADVAQVEVIEKSTFSIPWSYDSILRACRDDNYICIVCEENNHILGYCLMWMSFDEGNITNVAVVCECRGQGIGTLIMQAVEKEGIKAGIKVFFLEVRESNAGAIHLYEKCGYKQLGIRKNFYEKPVENAIIMSRILA